MTKDEIVAKLNNDLKNEWKHMLFYLNNTNTISGLHSIEFKEFFEDQAKEEMEHVNQFSKLIIGLDGNPFNGPFDQVSTFHSVYPALVKALEIEQEVLHNYIERIKDAEELGGVDGKWIEIFLENQIQNTREDVDKIRQFLSEALINKLTL